MEQILTFHFFLQAVEYLVYFAIVWTAAYQLYAALTTKQERKSHRTRVQKEFEERREKMVEKSSATTLAEKFEEAGNPLSLTALKFYVIRYLVFTAVLLYYVVIPLITEGTFSLSLLTVIVLLFVATSPRLSISLTHLGLNKVIAFYDRKKHIELFTLFDMLKAELKSLGSGQHVNVYHLLHEALPYFEFINGGITSFLRFWRTDPEKAREAFVKNIGGGHAEQLASILFKLDETSKNYAIEVIDGASKVFSTDYFESMNRRSEGKSITFNVLFFGVNILTLLWLIIMVVSMFSSTFENVNLGGIPK
ncbi:MAG TPA: hypothetical protein VFK44_06615 [Bacillales bacterium]|nr:hypothetical protein [Bacillales bacterium]